MVRVRVRVSDFGRVRVKVYLYNKILFFFSRLKLYSRHKKWLGFRV